MSEQMLNIQRLGQALSRTPEAAENTCLAIGSDSSALHLNNVTKSQD